VTAPPVPFAGVLRRLRVGAGLTQEELADAAGLSPRAADVSAELDVLSG
jgi:transcriptional regulator with XRE-family HTH domain